MSVRSKRLFGPIVVATAATTLYTCPAGETALLKEIVGVNTGALSGTINFSVDTGGGPVHFFTQAAGNSSVFSLVGRFMVFHPGDILSAVCITNTMRVTGFGAELEGVAD